MAKDPARRRREARRRIAVYGGLVALAWGFVAYQPMAWDLFPKPVPNPNPPVDPDSARLFAKGTRVVLVTAHPDDSEYYVAGTLLKLRRAGAQVAQIVMTDGDKGYYPWENAARNRAVRRAEQLAAARQTGVRDVVFLGYPDGRLQTSQGAVDRLVEAMRPFRPEYVLCFDDVYPPRVSHQDHRRSGTDASAAARRTPSVRWLLQFNGRAANYRVEVSPEWDKRLSLLALHRSQFEGAKLQAVQATVEDAAVEDAPDNGTYGEAFRCTRLGAR